ncbi:hypothetical protein ACFPAF_20420 [Hymenobacter endophyticus]|uniref:Uncharacterized protein n=1 Tax=Hymenobacter endophyticus TaxID=3076335 RepID=A0ABU3TN23_9BACT|nr:hypothetical protein [Hymenobacter endophyticus]MDU0372776.1 hypothetical protein [Hymenobacter endophyticus]
MLCLCALNSIEQRLAHRDAKYYLLFLLPQAERNNNAQAQQNPG